MIIPSPTLRVTEIFYSLQGESSWAGLPCAFVRLAGCGLGCRWCDTRYAANDTGTLMGIDAIVEEIRALGAPLVEITGGEPLEQEETPALASGLTAENYTVLVETNGAHDISVLPEPVIRIMDIKCPGSGAARKMDWDNIARLRPADEVKFVVASRPDYEFARETIARHDLSSRCGVLLSAVPGELDTGELADWALANRLPVRVQVQLHRILWPGRRREA